MLRRFRQINVFSDEPLGGNPLAVVLDSEGLTPENMQEYARWTNLSETAFVLPPGVPAADYKVRIFTPTTELPFAGHPTLGTCHAWRTSGGGSDGQTSFVQECAAGLISLRLTTRGLVFEAPPLVREGPVDKKELTAITEGLGVSAGDVIDARWIDNGPGWVGILLSSADRVLQIDNATVSGSVGVVGLNPEGSRTAYEVRAFFQSRSGTSEDPVTGSLNASVAQWMIATRRAKPPYSVSQGRRVGASGLVQV